MTARIEIAVSAKDIADAKRKVRALRPRVTGRHSNTKVEVDSGTLKSIFKVIDAVSLQRPHRAAVTRRPKAVEPTADAEISPQEAASILQMSRPSVMRLIEKGLLHPRKVLSRNKLLRAEVEAYRNAQTRRQREALNNLAALTEAYDF